MSDPAMPLGPLEIGASVRESAVPARPQRLQAVWSIFDALAGLDAFEVGATMTLVLLFFYVDGFWYLKIPVVVIAVAGVLYRPLLTTSNYWFAIAVFSAASAYQNWYTIDNHKYLMLYWCIALSVAAASSDPRATLRFNAKWLIALAFSFATVWKLMSKDFLDASFFYNNLLTEDRFQTLAKWIGGVPTTAFAATADALHELKRLEHPALAVKIYDSARLLAFARFMTWWTVILEGTIAAAFLVPERFQLSRLRNPALLVFLLTTYTAASVVGFGWVLAIMGYVQAPDDARWTKRLYLLAFALIFIYSGPWSNFFTGVSKLAAGGAPTP